MPKEFKLETPAAHSDLYLAAGAEADEFQLRPAFTGDVYAISETRAVALVQHPCAMRRGAALAPKLLVCEVEANPHGVPRDWSTGHYKHMFLPDLEGQSLTIEFEGLDVTERELLRSSKRRAILSSKGVNLLVQRWLYHNSRVVVPTITINAQTAGPFEEADLVYEACADLVEAHKCTAEAAAALIDDWLGAGEADGGPSRRQLLADPQQRSTVRASLRRQIKAWML